MQSQKLRKRKKRRLNKDGKKAEKTKKAKPGMEIVREKRRRNFKKEQELPKMRGRRILGCAQGQAYLRKVPLHGKDFC